MRTSSGMHSRRLAHVNVPRVIAVDEIVQPIVIKERIYRLRVKVKLLQERVAQRHLVHEPMWVVTLKGHRQFFIVRDALS